MWPLLELYNVWPPPQSPRPLTFNLSLRLSLSVVMRRRSDSASSRSHSTRRRTAWAARDVFGDLGERTISLLTLWSSSFDWKQILCQLVLWNFKQEILEWTFIKLQYKYSAHGLNFKQPIWGIKFVWQKYFGFRSLVSKCESLSCFVWLLVQQIGDVWSFSASLLNVMLNFLWTKQGFCMFKSITFDQNLTKLCSHFFFFFF